MGIWYGALDEGVKGEMALSVRSPRGLKSLAPIDLPSMTFGSTFEPRLHSHVCKVVVARCHKSRGYNGQFRGTAPT